MHNAKRTRPGSQYNAANQVATIDPNHYPFIKFPADSPVQPGDRVEWMDEDERLLTGSVLEEGAYLLQNVLYVRVDFDECIDAVVATSLTKVFDYEALDAETRIVVQQKTGEIKTLMRRSMQDIIDIGTKLIDVKTKLGHGSFGKWLDAEFGWTDRTARKFMAVANVFKSESGSDLNIGAKALYYLAGPSTPEEARQEAIERAEAGEIVTHAVAKAIVTALRPPVTPAPQPEPNSIAKAYQQAAQVLPPVTHPPAVTYGKPEDDYQEDVPSVDADEPDWLEDALAGNPAIEESSLKIGDIVTTNAGFTCGEILNFNPQMGALVKYKGNIPHWMKLDTLTKVEPETAAPAIASTRDFVFMVDDKVETHFGRKGGVVTEVDGERVGVKFPGSPSFWGMNVDFKLVERPVIKPVAVPAAPYAHHLSGSNEWYTPMQYVNAVRELMVGISLDPASCAYANLIVRAAHYYDITIDGLTQQWKGSVFLNPPYGWDEDGESNVATWTAKLLAEYKAKHVYEAVLLVNATTERKWFQPLWNFPICFTDHRINFYNAEGEQKQPTQGNAFVYLGEHIHTFANMFAQFGTIVRKV